MPMPTETSETARLRCVSNQPVTAAISGAKNAAIATPANRPNESWKTRSDGATLARSMAAMSSTAPMSTTMRGPSLSDRAPHPMLANAMARKPMVMAAEMPVRDQPVSSAIGTRKIGSEKRQPMATQPSTPPATTMTQR